MSIKLRMIIAVAIVFALGAAGIAVVMQRSYSSALEAASAQSVERAAVIFRELEAADTDKLAATVTGLADNPVYRDLFLAGDRDGLQRAAEPLFGRLRDEFRITHWYFETVGEKATVFLRVHRPEQHGDELTRATYLAAVESGSYGSGLELGKNAVALRVVYPMRSADGGEIVGFMELGQEIDRFLDQINEQTGDQVALLLLKEKMDEAAWSEYRAANGLDNNWGDNPDHVVAGATSDEVVADAAAFTGALADLPEQGRALGTKTEGGSTIANGAFPVIDASGETIGAVFVEHDITGTAAALRGERTSVLGLVVAMLLAVVLIVGYLVDRLVFHRLSAMTEEMENISTRLVGGDFDVHYPLSGAKDEVGRFEEFFAHFITAIGSSFKQLTSRR